jgi:hypothetical protein
MGNSRLGFRRWTGGSVGGPVRAGVLGAVGTSLLSTAGDVGVWRGEVGPAALGTAGRCKLGFALVGRPRERNGATNENSM